MLVSGAEAVDWGRRMHQRGVTGELHVDWQLIAFKRTFTDPVPKKREAAFAEQGIEAIHGTARFAGPDMIAVEGRAIKGRAIVIVTGARPVPLDFPGAEHVITSDAFMDLERLPKRIVMIGGGYIAAEFSHIAARAGAHVTVLQRGARMLPKFDADLVGSLMGKFKDIGIDVHTDNVVTGIERVGQELRVQTRTSRGTAVVTTDAAVHARGAGAGHR